MTDFRPGDIVQAEIKGFVFKFVLCNGGFVDLSNGEYHQYGVDDYNTLEDFCNNEIYTLAEARE